MKVFIVLLAVVLAASVAWRWAAKPSGVPSASGAVSSVKTPKLEKPGTTGIKSNTANSESHARLPAAKDSKQPGGAITPKAEGPPPLREEIIAQTKAALQIGSPTERLEAFKRLLSQTTDKAGLNSILETFQILFAAGRRFDTEWQAFWHGIANRDISGTLELIASHGPDTSWNATALSMTLNEWGGKDPQAAIQWLASHESEMRDGSFDAATLGLIAGFADHDLEGAARYALEVVKPGDPLSNRVTDSLAQRALQQRGTDGLISWFNGLSNDDQRQRMFRSMTEKLGSVSFDTKIAWLTAQAGSRFRDDLSYRDAASQLSKNDPRAGMDFVVQVGRSPKDGGFPGIGAASFEWLLQNPQDFSAWFRGLPAGDVRTNVLKALNNSLQNDAKLASDKRQQAEEFLKAVGG